jgi:hypothetical protein
VPPSQGLHPRRRRLRGAIFEDHLPDSDEGRRAIEGEVVDASPHLLVLATPDGSEVRLPMSATVSIWHGARAGPAALRTGREVIVRPSAAGGLVAERIWVDIVRVAGVITHRKANRIEVDAGPHRGHARVTIPDCALSRIQVRHPRMEPGSLLDVIGIRQGEEIHALRPATAPQPAVHADQTTSPERPAARTLRGTATWFERSDRARGAAYPALDPHGDAGGCGGSPAALPYLSIGSELHVRNDCTGLAERIPVIECGCLAARFCDRCVRCGTSPRGRVVELTRSAFVDLGGDLDAGCFNVTARLDER